MDSLPESITPAPDQLTSEQKDRLIKWAEALESGNYAQERLGLRRENRFCCLGVACEVYRTETGKGEWKPYGAGLYSDFHIGEVVEGSGLPEPVQRWLGFGDPVPSLQDLDGTQIDMISANDRLGYDFSRISALLRRTYDLNAKPTTSDGPP